jgi:flotillin
MILANTILPMVIFLALPAIIVFCLIVFFTQRFTRCPSNRVLVIYGKVADGKPAQCLHGGATMVWPVIQDYDYLSLEPIAVEVRIDDAVAHDRSRLTVTANYVVAIGTDEQSLQHAAARLLGMPQEKVQAAAREIIIGRTRRALTTVSLNEIENDRVAFEQLLRQEAAADLQTLGLVIVGVNLIGVASRAGVPA